MIGLVERLATQKVLTIGANCLTGGAQSNEAALVEDPGPVTDLADLVRINKISYEVGLEKCQHVEDYNRLTGRSARMNQGASALESVGNSATSSAGGF